MRIIIEVPDESREDVLEVIAWLEARKLSAFGQAISISPADDPYQTFWGAPLLSAEIPSDYTQETL